jgi:5-formyltetrahydrofolate cyclo-ligase
MTKIELRKLYLSKQKELTPVARAERSFHISQLFFRSLDLSEINFLHCFLPIERYHEIDTHIILEKLWKDFPRIETVVPRVNLDTNEIENLKFTHETELVLSNWQIHEPSHDELVAAEKIDAVIVPLLCFDESGHRVGYGKGFYDRFLAKCPPGVKKIGLSYFPPVKAIPDVYHLDIRLDLCLTPEKVWRF